MTHIMIDLEMNPTGTGRDVLKNEVIEIGAVKMDEEFRVTDQFQCYVRPERGEVIKKITKLTGITQNDVENAENFETAMERFLEWAGDEEYDIYSWSDSDLRQLVKEGREKGCGSVGTLADHWIDFQKEFGEMLEITKKLRLEYAVKCVDVEEEGRKHSAMWDAVNTGNLVRLSRNLPEFHKKAKAVIELFQPTQPLTIRDLCPALGCMACS